MRITQVSSGLTTTQALTSRAVAACCGRRPSMPNGNVQAEREAAARGRGADDEVAARQVEGLAANRLGHGCPPSRQACAPDRRAAVRRAAWTGGHVDGRANALIGAAAADVGHRLVDVGIGRVRRSS